MKSTAKRISCAFLVVVLSISAFLMPASARSSWYLDSYRAWLNPKSGGEISITVDVQATGDMDKLGATRIEVLEPKNDGVSWSRHKVYLPPIFPEMLTSGNYFYYDTPVSFTGTPGYKYCAVVTVYAGDSTGGDSRDYTTPIVTAKR